MSGAGSWLKAKWPGLHRFLTRRDGRWPLLREILAGAIVLGVLVGGLYGLTGQGVPFGGGYPVVVVTTGSMMHCENYPNSIAARDCIPTHWGRLGTIDPGDLVFVKKVTDPSDVVTKSEAEDSHYGQSGDVIVYRRNGDPNDTPIIHRSLFWVQINADRTFSVPSLHLDHVSSLNTKEVNDLAGASCETTLTSMFQGSANAYGAAGSGFVTRGDNNQFADQCAGVFPARMEWVLGKARGEVPWIGLINLLWGDMRTGSRHYAEAGGDSKVMFFVSIGVLIAAPWVIELVLRRRARKRQKRVQPEE